jgi:hypothetical protein
MINKFNEKVVLGNTLFDPRKNKFIKAVLTEEKITFQFQTLENAYGFFISNRPVGAITVEKTLADGSIKTMKQVALSDEPDSDSFSPWLGDSNNRYNEGQLFVNKRNSGAKFRVSYEDEYDHGSKASSSNSIYGSSSHVEPQNSLCVDTYRINIPAEFYLISLILIAFSLGHQYYRDIRAFLSLRRHH